MEIILILFLLIILLIVLYFIFRLVKWIFKKKIRIKWVLTLLGVFVLIVIIDNVVFNKTKFFPLESETSFDNGNVHKHIVIANPSKNLDSLAYSVRRYSKTSSNLCEMVENNYYLTIFYYKETWDTPRDFKSNDDDCNFDSEYIGCHTDDIICVLEKDGKQQDKWKFRVRKNRDSDWVHYPFEVKCNE